MALVYTEKLVNGSTSAANSFNTASWTPTANRLALLVVMSFNGTAWETPTITGNGMTWVLVAERHIVTNNSQLAVFRALSASPSAGAITIATVNNLTSVNWRVVEVTNTDTTGTNGSGAVVQSATAAATSAGTTLAATLAAFGDATNNGVFVAFGSSNAATPTFPGGYTAGTNNTTTGHAERAGYQIGQDTSPTVTTASITNRLVVALEIKLASATVPYKYRPAISMMQGA